MTTRKSVTESSAPGRPQLTAAMLSGGAGQTTSGMTEPAQISPELLASLTAQAEADMAPTFLPPGTNANLVAQAADAITGTWRQNVLVTALWCIAETRNAWIHLQSIGWKKIVNSRDGSFVALVTLASQAKQTGRPVTCREEADGIYEIYLW
jgi:hypothetical protein